MKANMIKPGRDYAVWDRNHGWGQNYVDHRYRMANAERVRVVEATTAQVRVRSEWNYGDERTAKGFLVQALNEAGDNKTNYAGKECVPFFVESRRIIHPWDVVADWRKAKADKETASKAAGVVNAAAWSAVSDLLKQAGLYPSDDRLWTSEKDQGLKVLAVTPQQAALLAQTMITLGMKGGE